MGRKKKEEVKADRNMISLADAVENFDIVEVLQYMTIDMKITVIDELVDLVLAKNEYGFMSVNTYSEEVYFKLKLVANYTNIDLDGCAVLDAYDEIIKNGLWDTLIAKLPSKEFELLCALYKKRIDEKLNENNSIVAFGAKLMGDLANKIPSGDEMTKLMGSLSEQVKNLDPEKLQFVKAATEALAKK